MFGTWSNWLSRSVTHESIRVFNPSSAPPQSGTDMTTPIHCLYRVWGGFCVFFNSPHGKANTEQLLCPHLWIITCHPFYCGTKNQMEKLSNRSNKKLEKMKQHLWGVLYFTCDIYLFMLISHLRTLRARGIWPVCHPTTRWRGHRCFSFTFWPQLA